MSRNVVSSARKPNEKNSNSELNGKMRNKKQEKCSTAETALKLAHWLAGKSGDTESSLTASSQHFLNHFESKCDCLNKTNIQLVVGCNYYQLFTLRMKQFSMDIAVHENTESCELSNSASENNEKSSESSETLTTAPYSNADSNKPSKFGYEFFSHLVNKRNCEKIIEPLKLAINFWEEAVKSQKAIDSNTMMKLELIYNILSCYYAFENYDVLNYKYRSAKLLLAISYLTKQVNLQLHAYYLIIQVLISSGAMTKAKSFLKKADFVLSTSTLKTMQTFETSLIFLAKCEIALYSGKAEQFAVDLVSFIESDYLQKVTLNRYFIKGLALSLASKFPPQLIKFTENFYEFIEPMQTSVCILKRWHRSYFPVNCEQSKRTEDVGDLDPTWYKFAVYGFAFKTYKTSSVFYVNSGTPVDLAFLHNALLKISRKFCFLSWILQLLISAAEIDLLCDKKVCALVKLNAAAILANNTNNYSQSKCFSVDSDSPSTHLQFHKTDFDIDNKEVTFSPEEFLNNFKDECAHQKQIPLWNLRHMLLKRNVNSDNVGGDGDEVFFNYTNLRFEENVDDDFFHFNCLKHEVYFHLATLQGREKSLATVLEQIHNKFTEYFENSFLMRIAEAIDVNGKEIENMFPLLHSSKILLKVIKCLISEHLKNGNFNEVVSLSEALISRVNKHLFGIEIQTLVSNILLKYAWAKFSIFNKESLIVEYNVSLLDAAIRSDDQCRTPSPKRQPMKKPLQPKAPKGKNEFKMDELKEYLLELSKSSVKKTNETKIVGHSSRLEMSQDTSVDRENFAVVNDILKVDEIYSSKKLIINKRKVLRSASSTQALLTPTKPRSKSVTVEAMKSSIKYTENTDISNLTSKDHLLTLKKIAQFEDIETFLSCILDLFGGHPPTQLYRETHFLMFQISCTSLLNEKTAHHFSECTTAAAIRYRNTLLTDRKKKNNVRKCLPADVFQFSSVDFNSELFRKCLNGLPTSWRIVQLHAVSKNTAIPDIYVSRYQSGKKPLFFKIKGNSEIFLQDFMSELYEIIELSNASISQKDVTTFWKVRFALENRFKLLMKGVDEMWFGPFIGVFMGEIQDKVFSEMCGRMKEKVLQLADKLNSTNDSLLDMIIESYALLTNEQFLFAIRTLFPNSGFAEECLKQCERIFHDFYPIEEKFSIFENLKTEPLGLILNKPLSAFPFETLPTVVKLQQDIFRIPSLRFLSVLYNKFKETNSLYSNGINPRSVYYLLNPSNNLPKTEQNFKEKFQMQTNWKGVIGCPPKSSDLKCSLETKDLYIFFGHGAGTSYYRSIPDGLEGTAVKSASLVIGCCSGKLNADGDSFEPYGTPWRFIMNGSPSYLGILWDVTDKDIDRFADRLLHNFLPDWNDNKNWKPMSLCNALVQSRDACKLKYLIGASPVVYGLPISVCK